MVKKKPRKLTWDRYGITNKNPTAEEMTIELKKLGEIQEKYKGKSDRSALMRQNKINILVKELKKYAT